VRGSVNTVRGTYIQGRRFEVLRQGWHSFQGHGGLRPRLDLLDAGSFRRRRARGIIRRFVEAATGGVEQHPPLEDAAGAGLRPASR
jgi:hypothetical protein